MALVLLFFTVFGHAKLIISFDDPKQAKMPIAIPDFVTPANSPISGQELANILRNDLLLTGLFVIVPSPPQPMTGPNGEPDFDAWARTGVQALVIGNVQVRGEELVLEARLYDVALKKMDIGKRYKAGLRDHRQVVHTFGDRVMESLTDVPGCFTTKIAFLGDAPPKELYIMDFDGNNVRQVSRTNTINMSPEWSIDGKSLLFTSYINRNPDLWVLDLKGSGLRPLSTRKGINASARYSPGGNTIALSLSPEGIPKIFLVTTEGHIIKRLTNGRGNDISPTWSPDGSAIAYVSDQAGVPQIYIVPVNEGRPRRVTFETNYNTDPDWSPRGDLLAFTARVDGRFQICTIRTDGTDFRVLTSQGSNQDPAWSPDGRMIAFTSDRDGRRRIYIMDALGTIQAPVSPIPGKAAAWSRTSG
jgi:TolB protein